MHFYACIFNLLILFTALSASAAVELMIKTLDERPLKQAAAGQSFLIVVTAPGDKTNEYPTIKGFENIQLESTNTMLLLVNNKARRTYKYRVRMDAPGEYTFGPAEINVDGKIEKSNSVKVFVGERQEVASQSDVKKALLRLTVDKSHVVVGEKVRCKLVFYGIPEVTFFERFLRTGSCESCRIANQEGPFTGSVTLNGTTYETIELSFDIYPSEPGRIIIPAYIAEYSVYQDADDAFAAMSFFFRQHRDRLKTYSNACTLHVDALPVDINSVNAVGDFVQFNAIVKPSVVKAGEGMVLTLELEGDGDFEAIEVPILQNMPENARWYDSKQYMSDSKRKGMQKKCYEYIVQVMDAGEYALPVQKFVFFDTKSRDVKTLQTVPLHVTIQKNPYGMTKDEGQPPLIQSDTNERVSQTEEMCRDELAPLHLVGWFKARKRMPISAFLFWVLFSLPLVWFLINIIRSYRMHHSPYFIRMNAFKNAKKEYIRAKKENNARALHSIFLKLLAVRFMVHKASLSQEKIVVLLKKSGLKQEKVDEWNQFFNKLGERLFFTQSNKENDNVIWEQAEQWIKELESFI